MTFGTSVKTCFSKFATFKGRASRSEFWWFELFNFVVGIILMIIAFSYDMQYLSSIYTVIVLIPCFAVQCRRFHDIGKSGWHQLWMLLLAMLIIPLFIMFFWDIKRSDNGANKYGVLEA